MATLSGRRGQLSITGTVLAAVMAFVVPTAGADPHADPEVEAQAVVYQINRARWSPAEFFDEVGLGLPAGLLPEPPVALNEDLTASATFKANEMGRYGYFAHQSEVTGKWPNRLARDFGYPLPSWWISDANYIESLNSGSTVPVLVVQSFAGSPSHRQHIFGQETFSEYLEIGVGRSDTSNYWAVHTAMRDDPALFVTGVVFDDRDRDGTLDVGEGLGGVTITTGNRSTRTNAGGGYSLEVSRGSYTITASGGGLAGSTRAQVTVTRYNVGVDFTSGDDPVVRAYRLCKGLPPTILGTEGDDTLRGTDRPDVIAGFGGNDVIYGLGGDDVICGGAGRDTIDGGRGHNRIAGGRGDDRIDGTVGPDRITGGRGDDVLIGTVAEDRLRGNKGDDEMVGRVG